MSPEDSAAGLFVALLVSVAANIVLSMRLTHRNDDCEAIKKFLKSTTTSRDRAEQHYRRLLGGLQELLKREREDS